ncbi:hypothetical protein SAMN06297144_1858 [Sphingomonas guangdongensis]|uniref:Uncharacterized protein n=2 Tax=Sphingomonas guangdongensis TaxID=1141890 RepID=A0A285QZE2_9SPHN|nr:hypothetical protein SAMN06297144_1858 [Sphingomonas guangdongensis]
MSRVLDWFRPKPVEQWNDPTEEAEHRKQRKRLSETHYMRGQSISAWLLATLVAINGGALATSRVAQANAWPFVIGVVIAVIGGFVMTQEAQDRTAFHYLESLADTNIKPYGKTLKRRLEWRWPMLRLLARTLNVASLSLFVVGCVLVAS